MAVPMVSSAKGVTFGGFACGVVHFAWQAWHFVSDVFCNVSKVVLCGRGRGNTFATFSQDELQISWQAQHFGRVHIVVILRGRRSTLDVSRCVTLANRNGRAASSGGKVQIPWQVLHFVRCDEN